ncbi:hypothetical protein YPPY47_4860 [Yersinia pestis PY-47]|uniref:Uncharacterized protein n=1 Tax=Yersinia pestis PY-08 TaxID=992134 RepID=A0AB72ZR28_YERPE|nr:hypothetical protein YPPY02_4784 [Yersinia pestis PY-02]EIQ97064.1 hypothetical protein YPPY05_4842 [Yersinia pestis PY-05]EIR25641.1 hypothetical protein YPPY10_4799 [Yersinia pestis PY-10]EIR26234.1 hypothetical protein YPPY08_4846 [Yersinia pestis PY-08]EIR41344.1 hypothetical protein YPPY12_4898 [Yersinia pestis PY-12]EIR41553.1 hypothetical protein YPPY11_4847 [Yersinia pestis PY-11]EIR58867.1 hypothetical protein YPPY25_4805 [Yersinia pestis PY-25]EIR84020.1 hypothetical protein YPP
MAITCCSGMKRGGEHDQLQRSYRGQPEVAAHLKPALCGEHTQSAE